MNSLALDHDHDHAHDDQPSEAHDARLHRVRHSLAHLLAEAVLQIRPGAKLGFGPAIDDGFYFDFVLKSPISEADFPEIERRMRALVAARPAFVREELASDDALARLRESGELYKAEYAEELIAKKGASSLSFYRSGGFVDMCEGPHVHHAGEIAADGFKLRSVAGAYWRGDSKNVMMTRIYAWAFLSKRELDARIAAHDEAALRDHKKLGRELDIFAFDDDVGKGLPLWLPNGTVLRDELEKLMRELEFEGDYQRVATPQVASAALFEQTGHLPYYADGMFPFMELSSGANDGHAPAERLCLRPMNCPHHHKIFAARKRSYRELPLRLAEHGQVYRYEDSGAISGLLRVRGMCVNDAHIYCTKEQIASECASVLEMHKRVYGILGLDDYRVRFSIRGEGDAAKDKYVDDPAAWSEAEAILKRALEASGLPFYVGVGEGAFYGPKIDFQFRSVSGREETASTLQLDFAVPKRLGLSYVGADGADHCPYVLHRAPLGTHERFVALLLEHFAGAFPTWLAPVQARVLPVSEAYRGYAQKIVRSLRAKQIRAEIDDSAESLGKRVRNASLRKIPNVVVVGEREEAEERVTLRASAPLAKAASAAPHARAGGAPSQESMPRAELEARLVRAIASRANGAI